MTGIEKITDRIKSDSQARSQSIISAAEKQCREMISAAEKSAGEQALQIEKNAEEEAKNIISMAESGAVQQARQIHLGARVDAINETVEKVKTALASLPDQIYFNYVIKFAAENAMKGECTAYLNEKDNGRLPASFAENLVSALSEKGAVCTLSDKPADIGSGIILDYGNIVADCSFDAIVDEKSDMIKEIISKIIF